MTDLLTSFPLALRVLAIGGLAAVAHGIVRGLRWASEWVLTPRGEHRQTIATRYPRVATVLTILVSALTFSIYFSALGFIFHEFGISLTAYFASASVVGLAVGFGSQGLVQDVVTGVTLIFSDVLNVGDVVDISGQTGRVEGIGLRFTQLSNLHEQSVFIPNRNITQINRYRNGYVRAYVDVQVPEDGNPDTVVEIVETLAGQMHGAHQAIIRSEPDSMGVCAASPEGWRYARVKFHLWPGQGSLIETAFRQRLLAALREKHPDYAEWMITVTYRAED